jgi:hypothetical protein
VTATTITSGVRRTRLTLVLILVLFATPLIIAWVLNFSGDFTPGATTNHGALVQPVRPVQATNWVDLHGVPVDPALFEHHWTLVYRLAGPCDEACLKALYVLRQVRLAQGKNIDRVQRLLLLEGAPNPEWSAEIQAHYPGLMIVRPDAGTALEFPVPGRIYLVDPLGNLMMEYAPDADPRGMIKDLERLLRISYVG